MIPGVSGGAAVHIQSDTIDWAPRGTVRNDWLLFAFDRTNLFRLFSNLLGLSLVMLADGWILVRLSRHLGVYLALALEAITAVFALVVIGSSIHRHLQRLYDTARLGRYDPRDYVRCITLVIGGVLLVLPGFAGDAIGLFFYLPPFRGVAMWVLLRLLRDRLPEVDEHLKLQLFSGDGRD